MKEKITQNLLGFLVVIVLILGIAVLVKPVPKTEVAIKIPPVEVVLNSFEPNLQGTGDWYEVLYDVIGISFATTTATTTDTGKVWLVGQIVYDPVYMSTTTATTSKYVQVPSNTDTFELNIRRNATKTDETMDLGFFVEYDYERKTTTTNQLYAEREVSTSGTINTYSVASTTNIWSSEIGVHGLTVEIPINGARAMKISFFRGNKYGNFEVFVNGMFHNDDK